MASVPQFDSIDDIVHGDAELVIDQAWKKRDLAKLIDYAENGLALYIEEPYPHQSRWEFSIANSILRNVVEDLPSANDNESPDDKAKRLEELNFRARVVRELSAKSLGFTEKKIMVVTLIQAVSHCVELLEMIAFETPLDTWMNIAVEEAREINDRRYNWYRGLAGSRLLAALCIKYIGDVLREKRPTVLEHLQLAEVIWRRSTFTFGLPKSTILEIEASIVPALNRLKALPGFYDSFYWKYYTKMKKIECMKHVIDAAFPLIQMHENGLPQYVIREILQNAYPECVNQDGKQWLSEREVIKALQDVYNLYQEKQRAAETKPRRSNRLIKK